MKRIMPNQYRRFWLAFAVLLLVAGVPASAIFMQPVGVPVERLVKNMSAELEKSPRDPDLHYRLARVHFLAFSMNARELAVIGKDAMAEPAGNQPEPVKSPPLPKDQQVQHVRQAVLHFDHAIRLAPKRALSRLGLASLLDVARDFAAETDINPLPPVGTRTEATKASYRALIAKLPEQEAIRSIRQTLGLECSDSSPGTWTRWMADELINARNDDDPARQAAIRLIIRDYWLRQSEIAYFQAFTLALEEDSRVRRITTLSGAISGLKAMISYESGQGFMKLVKARGESACDSVRMQTVAAALKAFEALPVSTAVTPIIFPLDTPRPLATLLDPSARVDFDLDATRRGLSWPWVRSGDAAPGILVWDPGATGKITSGAQLFGSRSWWMFFDDGYQALAALDDNHDGILSGPEFQGLAVWVDRNGDGRSDWGEVIPIERTSIVQIRVRSTTTHDGCPANLEGLTMSDGRVLPTYDWVAHVHPSPKQPLASRLPPTSHVTCSH